MLVKITKAVFALFAALFALAMVVAVALGAWLLTGPKQLSNFVPYVERSLNPEGAPYHTEVGDVVLHWDRITRPLDIRLKHVSVHTRDESAKLMRFDEVSVGLGLPGLLRFRLEPRSLVLRSPRMRFYRGDDGVMYVGIGSDDSQRVPLRLLVDQFRRDQDGKGDGTTLIGDIRFIRIQNARVILGESTDARLVDARDANLYIRRKDGKVKAGMDISFRYKDERVSYIRGDMDVSDDDSDHTANFELRDFSPHILSQLFPQQEELQALDLPLSGGIDLAFTDAGEVTRVDFRLQGRDGRFAYAPLFAEPLTLASVKLEGQVGAMFRHFELTKAELDFGGATLRVSGVAQHHPEGWTADAEATATDMPVNDLYKYWPKTIAPAAYDWVTAHIREGVVPKAEAKLALTRDHLGQPFPQEALDVRIEANGVTVDYLDGYPKVEGVDGEVAFTGRGMTITSRKGRMLSGSVLKEAWLQIPDLMAIPAPMQIKLEVEAPARDVASYIDSPALDFAAPLAMDAETISGQVAGTLAFDFLLPHHAVEDGNPQLAFVIDAELRDGAQPGFMGYAQVSGANGALRISEKRLTYDGAMAIAGAPLQIELAHDFRTKEKYPTSYRAKGRMTVEQLRAFHVPELPFLSGALEMDARIQRNPEEYNVVVTADLRETAADVTAIGLVKPAGKPARLDFEADIAGGELALHRFLLEGEDIHIAGSGRVGNGLTSLQALRLDRVEYGDNNFTATLDRQGEGYRIAAKGPSLDMRPFFGRHDTPSEEEVARESDVESDMSAEGEEENGASPPLVLDARGEFDWVVFGKERELRNVVLRADCRGGLCEQLLAQGLTGRDDRFSYEVTRDGDGIRRMRFSTRNAGGFLRAINLYDGMQGGVMTANGHFDDKAPRRPFIGELRVTEHRITDAPVLAQMASLLSLSGIGDALSGDGIAFREIESAIGFADGVMTFREGRAYGPALGITIEDGAVNLRNRQVKVSGTVVPSYTLNTVLGNIPVIGEALSGGKGEGVFAATYKVEGKYPAAVEVSVNPLSMLAPGFLRNVFGSGESAAEAVKSEADAAAEGDPAPVSVTPPPEVQPEPDSASGKNDTVQEQGVTPPSQ